MFDFYNLGQVAVCGILVYFAFKYFSMKREIESMLSQRELETMYTTINNLRQDFNREVERLDRDMIRMMEDK